MRNIRVYRGNNIVNMYTPAQSRLNWVSELGSCAALPHQGVLHEIQCLATTMLLLVSKEPPDCSEAVGEDSQVLGVG